MTNKQQNARIIFFLGTLAGSLAYGLLTGKDGIASLGIFLSLIAILRNI